MITQTGGWLQTVEDAVSEQLNISLWGSPPAFPWEDAAMQIATRLKLPKLTLSHKETKRLPFKELLNGLGEHPLQLPLSLAPLSDSFVMVMPRDQVEKLSEKLITAKEEKGFTDPNFQKAFFQYVTLEAIDALKPLNSFQSLNLQLAASCPLPEEGALCLDIAVQIEDQSFNARIICPDAFAQTFKSHFARQKTALEDLATQIDSSLVLNVDIGAVTLQHDEWTNVKKGDFIRLDQCDYDSDAQRGHAGLVLARRCLFQLAIEEGKVTISPGNNFLEDFTTMDEEENKQPPAEEEPIGGPLSIDDMEEPASAPSADLIDAKKVPLNIKVEVGQIEMSLQELLELQIGSTLDLSVRPEQGVYLTLNGKKIAQAELLKIGEVLGVRIIKLSKT